MVEDSEMRRLARTVDPCGRDGAVAMWSDRVASARVGAEWITLSIADEVS